MRSSRSGPVGCVATNQKLRWQHEIATQEDAPRLSWRIFADGNIASPRSSSIFHVVTSTPCLTWPPKSLCH